MSGLNERAILSTGPSTRWACGFASCRLGPLEIQVPVDSERLKPVQVFGMASPRRGSLELECQRCPWTVPDSFDRVPGVLCGKPSSLGIRTTEGTEKPPRKTGRLGNFGFVGNLASEIVLPFFLVLNLLQAPILPILFFSRVQTEGRAKQLSRQ